MYNTTCIVYYFMLLYAKLKINLRYESCCSVLVLVILFLEHSLYVLQMISRVIFEAFANPDPTKKDNAAGIQLLGIIAANDLSPIAIDSNIDEDR